MRTAPKPRAHGKGSEETEGKAIFSRGRLQERKTCKGRRRKRKEGEKVEWVERVDIAQRKSAGILRKEKGHFFWRFRPKKSLQFPARPLDGLCAVTSPSRYRAGSMQNRDARAQGGYILQLWRLYAGSSGSKSSDTKRAEVRKLDCPRLPKGPSTP